MTFQQHAKTTFHFTGQKLRFLLICVFAYMRFRNNNRQVVAL
ncbi:hypothetical protein T11_5393 [Trichinella zimbabwensis]|uniref:Uncharacterized protein n=1 Tax=Trichinella zimbabwensis TaxID=268475 RepID=A0A0V1GB19_9BILA|nr:hypothetical protein T11_5393 [Trichinella zimbabwensis]